MEKRWPLIVVAIIIVMVLATITCCALTLIFRESIGSGIIGSQALATQEMALTGFSRIDAGHAFRLEITQSPSFAVEITASENVIDHVQVVSKNGTLTLGLAPGRRYSNTRLTARISMPRLDSLALSGAARATLQGEWVSDKLAMDLSGASLAEGATVQADAMVLELSGSSRLDLAGQTGELSVKASGASKLDLEELTARDASVELSGASNCAVSVTDALEANLSGASNLDYLGDPKLGRIETSGASRVNKR